MERIVNLAEKLSELSIANYNNPYLLFEWPENLDEDAWYFTPEYISIYGTSEFEQLTTADQKRLSLLEAVNFFSLNIHGEKSLMRGLTKRLYHNRPKEVSDYLHHFVGEENKHMSLFGKFCNRYLGKVYPSRAYEIPNELGEAEEDFLFFVKVVIFEELVDFYNLNMSDDERLHDLARGINQYHHNDEVRHISFGRTITRNLFNQLKPEWSEEKLFQIQAYILAYIESTWKEYYNPYVYNDMKFENAYALFETAWALDGTRAHRAKAGRKCYKYLLDAGMLIQEPEV